MAIKASQINIEDYGADNTGTGDSYIPMRKALAKAIATGVPLYIPPGTFRITNRLVITGGVKITGAGRKSIVLVDNDLVAGFYAVGATGVVIRDLLVKSLATVRNSFQSLIHYHQCTNSSIANVYGDGSAGVFVRLSQSTDINVEGCNYKNTLADGIHMTDKCLRITVQGNHGENTGDDGISVVCYQSDITPCTDITIHGNTILNSKTRGITNVGGERVTITNNKINGTASSGILVLRDSSYTTLSPVDTTVHDNMITNIGSVTPQAGNQIGIEIGLDANRTMVSFNKINTSTNRGITAISTATELQVLYNHVGLTAHSGYEFIGLTGMVCIGNTSRLAGRYGLYVDSVMDSDFSHNRIYNSNTTNTTNVDNILFTNACNNCTVSHNRAADTVTPVRSERGIEITNCQNFIIGQNYVSVGSQTEPVFGSGNVGHKRTDTVTVTGVPTITYYAIGQRVFNIGDGLWYTYDGSLWTTPASGGGGGGSFAVVERLTSLPTASVTHNGRMVQLLGILNRHDRTYICKKFGDNNYHWKQID